MGILIKLGMVGVAVMVAFSFLTALIPSAAIFTLFSACAIAIINAGLAGFRHGNSGAAWQGCCDGFGGTVKFGVGVLKTITKMTFTIVKGLA